MSKRLIIAILALFMAGVAFAQLVPTSKMEGKVVDDDGRSASRRFGRSDEPQAGRQGDGGHGRGRHLPSVLAAFRHLRGDLHPPGLQDPDPEGHHRPAVPDDHPERRRSTQAALEEQVTVIGQSPLIDVKSTVKGQTMTKEVFMALPRNRSFDGLMSTVPGVQYDNRTGGLSVDGATGTENMWYMDGTDITSVHIGTSAQGAVMELVDEVKVTASGYNAEFGGSMGGVVNVITRSGGNAFHGDVSLATTTTTAG